MMGDGLVPREITDETMDAVHEMSDLLHTGLNRESLEILTKLCDYGARRPRDFSLAARARVRTTRVANRR